jgi:2-aminoethylphosphonate-pyruvate transaminase
MTLAVILAAGLGSRLKNKLTEGPKGFIEFDGKAIINRSIENLKSSGISSIIIATGHLSKFYEELEDNELIFCKKNDFYANTGSFFTLYNLNNYINNDFLLLESDLLYERRAINLLINHRESDVILASGRTLSGDEVFIEVNSNNRLSHLSKNQRSLSNVFGELVGISKISLNTYKMLCDWAKKNMNEAKLLHYEEALVRIRNKNNFYVERIDDLIWTEIDTEEHYERAVEKIYPLLKKIENE